MGKFQYHGVRPHPEVPTLSYSARAPESGWPLGPIVGTRGRRGQKGILHIFLSDLVIVVLQVGCRY
jgi:hypothetical protein